MNARKLILIAGRNAVLAQELDEMLWPAGYEARQMTAIELGILDIERLRRNIKALSPALIINTIGYSSPDLAESHRVMAQARSHWSVGDLAEVAGECGIPLLHLSSDQVFAGDKGTPYLETDRPDAVSVFGQALAAGEAEVGAHCANYAILRTGWLFGAKGHNMLRTMLSLGRRGGRIHVPNDHISARPRCASFARHCAVSGWPWSKGNSPAGRSFIFPAHRSRPGSNSPVKP